MNKAFKDIELIVPEPDFGSALTSLVLELEKLRNIRLHGTTYAPLFYELKQIFHFLESIGSARIEGNRTTIAQFVESKIEDRPFINEDIEEIRNIERAMNWIDHQAPDYSINRAFVSELHKMIVKNLTPQPKGEGDLNPGMYREHPVEIRGTKHLPPPPFLVEQYMEELFDFLNQKLPSQYDLIRIAVAHHRFMWIHPFGNGNGRTGRLLTYAMLVQTGFRVHVGQILNPTAVFCIDRDKYNELLSNADEGTEEAISNWCMYVLEGLNGEIRKIERLSDQVYVRESLLLPALSYSYKMKYIDQEEYAILKVAAQESVIQAKNLRLVLKGVHPGTISRKIRGLRERKMLRSETEGGNKYHLSFINNFLMRGVINALEAEGYVPLRD